MYGFRQTCLRAWDRIFPRHSVSPGKIPDCSASAVRFVCDDLIVSGIDSVSRSMIDASGGFALHSSGADVSLLPGTLQRIAAFLETVPETDILYADSAICAENGKITGYEFRPDFALEYLRSDDYFGKLIVVRRSFAKKFPGATNLELMLRGVENGVNIVHIPQLLYTHRSEAPSCDGVESVAEHLDRCGIAFEEVIAGNRHRRIKYAVEGGPLISILIPSFNNCAVLRRCIDSIIQKTTWKNLEIVIVENGSNEAELFDYYKTLQEDPRIKVVSYPVAESFNYSRVNNFGAKQCSGDYILFLNNDTEVISGNFLEEMLSFAQRPDVGVTGAKLYYFDRTLQHAGVIVGAGSIAAHHSWRSSENDGGYLNTLACAREFSAVTFACAMVRKSDFFQFGALDEALGVAYNDIDFCLRMVAHGKRVIYTPYAELFHHESLSRGREDTPEKQARIAGEAALFEERHREILENGDPFYNPHLSLSGQSFTLRGRLGRLKLVQRKKRS